MLKRTFLMPIMAGAVLAAACMAAGCASAGMAGGTAAKPARPVQNQPVVIGRNVSPQELAAGEMLSVTKPASGSAVLQSGAWSKVRIFDALLSDMEAHEEFSTEDKAQLFNLLFAGVPWNVPDGVVRQVYVGKFFQDGSPLELRVALMTPAAGSPAFGGKALILMSNMVKVFDKDGKFKPSRVRGAFVDLDRNAAVAAIVKDGMITQLSDLAPAGGWNYEADAGKDAVGRIMAAQSYLADEQPGNDQRAADLLHGVFDASADQPSLQAMALLKLYEWRLSRDELDDAEQVWKSLIELAPRVPGDMTPENLDRMNGNDLRLMRMLAKQAG